MLAAIGPILVAVVTARPADAHAVLESSEPAAGSTVAAPPSRIELTFGEPVSFTDEAIRMFDPAGHEISLQPAFHPGGSGSEVASMVPKLSSGTYVVAWRVVSADSHPLNGAFTFSVGSSSGGEQGLASKFAASSGSRTVGVPSGVIRGLGYLATTLVIGGFFFVVHCWPEGATSDRVRRWLTWSAVGGVIASVLAIALQGPYGNGSGIGQVVSSSAWAETISTRFGHAGVVRIVCFVAALLIARELARAGTIAWRVGAVLVSLGIAASIAAAGHGATGRWVPMAAMLDVVHVLGFSVWIGGLVGLLWWALRDAGPDESIDASKRFSSAAIVAVAAIIISGTLQGVRQVGWSWVALDSTTYGRLLIAKVAVVAIVIVVARVSRTHVHAFIAPAEVEDQSPVMRRNLRRPIVLEMLGLAVVLVLSTLLSGVIPAREAVELPFDQTVLNSGGVARIEVLPADVGRNQIHVTVTNPDGTVPDIAEMHVELSLPDRDLGPIDIAMVKVASSHYLQDSADIPFPGDWTLTARVRVGEFDENTFTVRVPVR